MPSASSSTLIIGTRAVGGAGTGSHNAITVYHFKMMMPYTTVPVNTASARLREQQTLGDQRPGAVSAVARSEK